jgi:hypothetical protein
MAVSLKENNWFFVTDQTPRQCRPRYNKIGIFGTKINHLATLVARKASNISVFSGRRQSRELPSSVTTQHIEIYQSLQVANLRNTAASKVLL